MFCNKGFIIQSSLELRTVFINPSNRVENGDFRHFCLYKSPSELITLGLDFACLIFM